MMLDSETTKTYTRPISKAWWLRDRGHFNRRYFMFLLRELTSVFVALYVVLFIYEIFLLTKGPDAHAAFRESLSSGPWIAFHVIALLFALYHSWTWLGLTTKMQAAGRGLVKIGTKTLPPIFIALGSYGAWIVATIVIAYLFLTL
ncbi:MAG: hypothetical protein OXI59_09660 [Gemmatimonadota bacterium]|nr:hypothetical protein [Gemmatimonadota bacterium]MDE2953647.1 hypothetical protein [Gemmatimonadota bacterium]